MSEMIIIEESRDARDRVAEMATELGFEVQQAETCAIGAAMIKEGAPTLVCVSATLPDTSGYELASSLAYDYSMSVILMVDEDARLGQKMLLSKGVIEFVYRPVKLSEFAARIKRAQEISTMLRVRERLVFELERLSQTDGLTGLLNVRIFFKRLKLATRLAEKDGKPLALLMLDLDHFKRLNDTLGHSVGNDALQEVGAVLLANMKSGQQAFRYGGEEFTILLTGVNDDAVLALAEKLRQEIETMGRQKHPKSPVTGSIGVGYFDKSETPESWMARVDKAMYEAKQAGRNRIEIAALAVPES